MLQGVILFVVIGTELLFRYRIRVEKVDRAIASQSEGTP
jgi:hypothetical protein